MNIHYLRSGKNINAWLNCPKVALTPGRATTGRTMVWCAIVLYTLLAGFLFCGKYTEFAVLAAVSLTVATNVRRLGSLCSVLLFGLSHTPYSLPTYIVALSPLVWIWRQEVEGSTIGRCVIEGVAVGFAMCWLITGFVEPAVPPYGFLLHSAGCLAYGVPVSILAVALRLTRRWSMIFVAGPMALLSVALEMFQAGAGLVWATTNPGLAIASTPIAQWSGVLTPFGLSFVLYGVNYLLLPGTTGSSVLRYSGTLTAALTVGVLWIGGNVIEVTTKVLPLPFSVLLVQPNLYYEMNKPWMPWRVLHSLTLDSIERNGKADLIVWPETCLSESHYGPANASPPESRPYTMTLNDFRREMLPQFATTCLLGVTMVDTVVSSKYGRDVTEEQRFNCGCLVSVADIVDCHEKTILVPMKEGLPKWLQFAWVRNISTIFGLHAPYEMGRDYHTLKFRDQKGEQHTIAAAVCYESWHPWLSQYSNKEHVDAIVYTMYDGDFVAHPELIERQLLSVRMRAIETRTWSFVSSCWQGTAIIDPRGRIVRKLMPIAGVLRSDQMTKRTLENKDASF